MKNFKVIVYFVLVICDQAFAHTEGSGPNQRVKRVIQGFNVFSGDHKYMLSLKYAIDSKHFCGGTRLAEKWALTAAHCTVNLKPVQFYVTTTTNKSILIDKIIENDFNPVNYSNDIALLRLRTRNDGVASTVLLPNNYVKPGEKCLILGEGAVEYAGRNSGVLLAGYVDIISYEQCLSKLGRVMTPERRSGMFCAGGKGVDACNGDSGGPLLCKNRNGDYELTGIISYGVGCGTYGVPGVYTGTYHHIKWINNTIFGMRRFF